MAHHLHRQISQIKKLLLGLGALVEQSLQSSITAVLNRDPDLARRVIESDAKIDEMEVDIEEECLQTLALYQPVAHDLRFIVAVLKINNDLERIGDLAVNMAEQAIFLAGETEVDTPPFDLRALGLRVETMLHKSLDALVNLDVEQAQVVRDLDDEVDATHRKTYEKVSASIREDPAELEQMIHYLNLSRQLERIADHATNVAKDVMYMAKGEIVRHRAARERRERAEAEAAAAAEAQAQAHKPGE